jgi:beta-catenin-like protein 1
LCAIGLLQEMTDSTSTSFEEEEEGGEGERKFVWCLVEALVQSQGLELLVQNLSRLDEASEEDAVGVHHTLAILENLSLLAPTPTLTPTLAAPLAASPSATAPAPSPPAKDLCEMIAERTDILKFLVKRLNAKKFDANKLYCSEVLSILLQGRPSVQLLLGQMGGASSIDGMDSILQAIALYRKKEVDSSDEQVILCD